jgi:hypothetical protein
MFAVLGRTGIFFIVLLLAGCAFFGRGDQYRDQNMDFGSIRTVAVMPLGVLTAVYLHEYAPRDSRLATLVRVAVQNLAGVPSIVFGLFGLGFFIQFVGRGLDRAFSPAGTVHYGQPALVWAALTLAIITIPVVIVSTEEALAAVETARAIFPRLSFDLIYARPGQTPAAWARPRRAGPRRPGQ